MIVYEVWYVNQFGQVCSDELFSTREAAARWIEHDRGAKQVSWSQDAWQGSAWKFYISERKVRD